MNSGLVLQGLIKIRFWCSMKRVLLDKDKGDFLLTVSLNVVHIIQLDLGIHEFRRENLL